MQRAAASTVCLRQGLSLVCMCLCVRAVTLHQHKSPRVTATVTASCFKKNRLTDGEYAWRTHVGTNSIIHPVDGVQMNNKHLVNWDSTEGGVYSFTNIHLLNITWEIN